MYVGAVSSQEELLDLQDLDTRLDQLAHKRETLPERAEIEELRSQKQRGERAQETVFANLREKQSAQKALEDESATSLEKKQTIEAKLYDGSVTNAKELEAFQAEASMLGNRVSELDDRVLEVMEEVEPLEQQLADTRAAVARIEENLAAKVSALGAAEADLDAEIAGVTAERGTVAESVNADLLALYESLRKGLGGVGAARLDGNRCTGCHLEIPSADLDAIRHADAEATVTCPECQRILVR
jgi:predicted  nucleic acid-binding Zn-ribbon protein